MLVTFRFKNYGPFRDEAILDMRAVKSYKEHPDNLIAEYEDTPILKVAAIYGANASGKSQFVDAFWAFRELVLQSFQKNNKDPGSTFLEEKYSPFKFVTDSEDVGTEFELIFRKGDKEYRYGFVFNQIRIEYEWLYQTSLKTKRQSIILERSPDKIELGSSVRRSCEKYLRDIDSDVLALSFFSSLKLQNTVFSSVLLDIAIMVPIKLSRDDYADAMLDLYFENYFDDDEKEKLLNYLKAIDTGIKGITVEKNGKNIAVYTHHVGKDGSTHLFPIELESDGTRRAISIYSFVRLSMRYGTLIMDEFHSQLHPLLQKYILDLFYEQSDGGQIIYTTHDTTLLDKKFTRRDQIWFTTKNEDGESSLYSLADFNIRNDRSFEKDYLSGIYGGIPNLKDFSFEGGIVNGEG